jgi:hypothetical protein
MKLNPILKLGHVASASAALLAPVLFLSAMHLGTRPVAGVTAACSGLRRGTKGISPFTENGSKL